MNHLRGIDGGGRDNSRRASAAVLFYEELDPLIADLRGALDQHDDRRASMLARELGLLADDLQQLLAGDSLPPRPSA